MVGKRALIRHSEADPHRQNRRTDNRSTLFGGAVHHSRVRKVGVRLRDPVRQYTVLAATQKAAS